MNLLRTRLLQLFIFAISIGALNAAKDGNTSKDFASAVGKLARTECDPAVASRFLDSVNDDFEYSDHIEQLLLSSKISALEPEQKAKVFENLWRAADQRIKNSKAREEFVRFKDSVGNIIFVGLGGEVVAFLPDGRIFSSLIHRLILHDGSQFPEFGSLDEIQAFAKKVRGMPADQIHLDLQAKDFEHWILKKKPESKATIRTEGKRLENPSKKAVVSLASSQEEQANSAGAIDYHHFNFREEDLGHRIISSRSPAENAIIHSPQGLIRLSALRKKKPDLAEFLDRLLESQSRFREPKEIFPKEVGRWMLTSDLTSADSDSYTSGKHDKLSGEDNFNALTVAIEALFRKSPGEVINEIRSFTWAHIHPGPSPLSSADILSSQYLFGALKEHSEMKTVIKAQSRYRAIAISKLYDGDYLVAIYELSPQTPLLPRERLEHLLDDRK